MGFKDEYTTLTILDNTLKDANATEQQKAEEVKKGIVSDDTYALLKSQDRLIQAIRRNK